MQIGAQIRERRLARGLSQEELAERVYVTRQTVSNWENEKSYPDIHSLLLLSALFEISLDRLIKGDIERMKQQLDREEVERFNRLGARFALLFLASAALFAPLAVFLKIYGIILWAILYLITLLIAFRVERLKKEHDLHTYKEIVAFSEGKTLDELQKQREAGKRPYQTALKWIAGACVGAAIAAVTLAALAGR